MSLCVYFFTKTTIMDYTKQSQTAMGRSNRAKDKLWIKRFLHKAPYVNL